MLRELLSGVGDAITKSIIVQTKREMPAADYLIQDGSPGGALLPAWIIDFLAPGKFGY